MAIELLTESLKLLNQKNKTLLVEAVKMFKKAVEIDPELETAKRFIEDTAKVNGNNK